MTKGAVLCQKIVCKRLENQKIKIQNVEIYFSMRERYLCYGLRGLATTCGMVQTRFDQFDARTASKCGRKLSASNTSD